MELLTLPLIPQIRYEVSFSTEIVESASAIEQRIPKLCEPQIKLTTSEMVLTESEWFVLRDFFKDRDGKKEPFLFELPFDWLSGYNTYLLNGKVYKSFSVGGVTTRKKMNGMTTTTQKTRLQLRFDTENIEAFQIVKQPDYNAHPFLPYTETYYRVSPIAMIEVLEATDITYTAADFGALSTSFVYPVLPINSQGDKIIVQVEGSDSGIEGRFKRGEKDLLKYNSTVLYLEEFETVLTHFLASKGRLLSHGDGYRFDSDTLGFTQLTEDVYQVDNIDLVKPANTSPQTPTLIFTDTSSFNQDFNSPPNGTYTFTINAPSSLNSYPAANVKAYIISASWDDTAALGNFYRGTLGSFSGTELVGVGKKSYTAIVNQTGNGPCFFSGQIRWEVYDSSLSVLNPVFPYCSLVKIVRRDGTIEGFSSWGANLTISGVLYKGNTAINPTAINKKSGISTDNLEFRSFLSDNNISDFSIEAGLYEDAWVTLYIANLHTLATEITFYGFVGEITKTDSYFIFELQSQTTLLERAISKKTATRCSYQFCDEYCGLNINSFKTTRTVSHQMTSKSIKVLSSSIGGEFKEGYFVFETGVLKGARFDIKEANGGQDVHTHRIIPDAIGNGTDQITLYQGCKKNQSDCNFYSNIANFGGFPSGGNWFPGPDIYMN